MNKRWPGSRERRLDALIITGLFALAILFIGDALAPGEGQLIAGFDLHNFFAPLLQSTMTAIRGGRVPLWNPQLFLGFPQYAEPQLSTFYPPIWLLAGQRLAVAVAWLYALHLGLAGSGGYVLARQLGARWRGGLLAGLVLGFNAFMSAHLYGGHFAHIMTIAYLPWLLAAAWWAARPRPPLARLAATLTAAVPLALAMLAGYAPFFPYLVIAVSVLLLGLALAAWRGGDRREALLLAGQWAALGAFAGLLAAVQLLPTAEFTLLSSRLAGADYQFASSYSMPIWNLLTLLLPDLYGAPVGEVTYWANYPINGYWELAIYAGILPLLLTGLAAPLGQRSWRVWLVVALLGLLLALGAAGGLHRVFFQLVPGFRLFRVPARLGYYFTLAAALLTGLMFERWLDLAPETARRWQAHLRRLLVWGVSLSLLLILLSVLWQAVQTDYVMIRQISGVTSQLVRFTLLFAAALLLLIWGRERPPWQPTLLAAALLLVDLWGFGNKLITLEPEGPALGWVMADVALAPDRANYRVISAKGLNSNGGLWFGFHDVGGYDDFRTEFSAQFEEMAFWDTRTAELLGVRYLLLGPESDGAPPVPGWNLVTEPAGVHIYERDGVAPRAFVVHQVVGAADAAEALQKIGDPAFDWRTTAVVQVLPDTACAVEAGDPAAAQVELAAYAAERVELRTTTAAAGWLILADVYYPGWQAFVDGQEVTIQPTNYGLRGICLPGGRHEVAFVFDPAIYPAGIAVSAAAWALLVGVGLAALAARRRR